MSKIVFRVTNSGGVSYITPFAYYDFETGGTQYVTNVLGTNNYTGSFSSDTDGISNFGLDTDPAFMGSKSVQFPSGFTGRHLSLGTPEERSSWSSLFSGSFSVSAWVYLPQTEGNNYLIQDTRIFGQNLKSNAYGFWFGTDRGKPAVYSRTATEVGTQAAVQRFGNDDSTNYVGWNHFVFVVDGDTSATNRRIKAYINNTDFGYVDESTSNAYFQKLFLDDEFVFFGNPQSANKGEINLDEVSLWSIALSDAQVSTLYNSGNGVNALSALTS